MITGLDIYSKKLICSECGSTVKGRYNRYDNSDKILCEKCSKRSSKCDICSVPSALLDKYIHLKVCPSCLSKKDICACCGNKINESNRKIIKGISAFFCSDCLSKAKHNKCGVCNRPIKENDKHVRNINDKKICKTCYNTHIFNNDVAKNILGNISRIIDSKFGLNSKNIPELSLSSEVELKFLRKMKSSSLINTEEKVSISALEKRYPVIYVKSGLPISKFISSVVSEYIMCWFRINKYYKGNYERHYNFSKWVSMKVLTILGYQEERKEIIMREALNKRKSGLSDLIKMEKEDGTDAVIEFATSGVKRVKAV